MNRQLIFGDAFCWVRFNFLQEGGAVDYILDFVCLCQLFFLEVVTIRLEYSCNMALQSFTEFNSYPFFSIFLSLSVFVFVLPHVLVIVFVLPIFTMTPMHFPKSRHCPTQNLYLLRLETLKCFKGRGGPFPLSFSDPPL